MQHSVEYNATDKIIEARVQGDVELSEMKALANEIVQAVKQSGCMRVITDLRTANLNLSLIDLYYIPMTISEAAAAAELNLAQIRRAFVVSKSMKLFGFYETVSLNRGHATKLFFDIDEARSWLKK